MQQLASDAGMIPPCLLPRGGFMALEPGTRLGPYEIQSAIGVGGMGEVYKAQDTRDRKSTRLNSSH